MKKSSNPAEATTAASSRAQPRRRRLAWIIGIAIVALIAAGFWPKPLPVELAAVSRGGLRVSVSEEGMTRLKRRYMVSSPVAGYLQRIDWKPGADVVAGETILAVLETSEADLLDAGTQAQAEARVHAAEATVAQAAAQVERARAAHEMAAADLGRFRSLAQSQVVSQQELDVVVMREATASQELRAAEFSRQVATYELEQARAILGRGREAADPGAKQTPVIVRSPVSGRLLRVFQESARPVTAGFPLVEVGDSTDLELRIEVLSRDAVGIRPGARMLVEQWGGARPLEARVRVVEPAAFTKISALGVEEQRVYVVGDFIDAIDQRPTLGDSYRVEGRIVVWEGAHVLRVPAGALFQRGNLWQTFVVDGSTAKLRSVKPGRSDGVHTEILEGLVEGEKVIVYPGDKIAEGVRVKSIEINPGKTKD
jgi:HlyD family secretion protein